MNKKEIDEIDKRLLEAFPTDDMPMEEPMLWSNHPDEESVKMTRVFVGKKWNELMPKDFEYSMGDMAFLREPWHFYYLPALIHCSMDEIYSYGYLKSTDLAVGFMMYYLDSYAYPQFNTRSDMRKIFSIKQLQILKDWIYALAFHVDSDHTMNHLIDFLENCLGRHNSTADC